MGAPQSRVGGVESLAGATVVHWLVATPCGHPSRSPFSPRDWRFFRCNQGTEPRWIGSIALTTTIAAVSVTVTETVGRVTAVTHRPNTGQPWAFAGMGGIA
jgi:hypothetical protein